MLLLVNFCSNNVFDLCVFGDPARLFSGTATEFKDCRASKRQHPSDDLCLVVNKLSFGAFDLHE